MSNLYKKPVIKRGKKWFIEYYYRNPFYKVSGQAREFERFKVYENINRLEGDEQELYAAELREAVEVALQNGHDPYEEKARKLQRESEKKAEQDALLSAGAKGERIIVALDKFLQAKRTEGLAERSIGSYTTPINHFKNWLSANEWLDRGVKQFTDDDIIRFMSEMQKSRNWGGKTFNTNRDFVKQWFDWFELEGYIDRNPITKRLRPQKEQSIKNEYYHGRIKTMVQKALKSEPLLEYACQFIYYAAVRSYRELSSIKVGDIDLESRVIKIKKGKTGYRFVPICDELNDLLISKHLERYPLEFYLFSKLGVPSMQELDKNFLSRRYRILLDRLELGKEYGMYSWKHTRVVELKNAGYKDAEIQDLTGHTDSKSYDAYSRNFGTSLNNRLRGSTIKF